MADPLPAFMQDAVPVEQDEQLPDFMAGAQPVDAAPVAPTLTPEQYKSQLLEVVGSGASKADVAKFAADNGQQIDNLDEVIRYRDTHRGAVSKEVLGLPRDEDGNIATRFLEGAMRAPGQMVEGLAQLLIRGGNALGLVDDVDANMAQEVLANRGEEKDAAQIRGTAGTIGNIAGEVATTAAVPMGRVATGGKLVKTALTVGKRALAGGAISGLSGAEATAGEQNTKAAVGAVLTPLMIPALEKVFAKVGGQVGNVYQRIAGNGVGKQLYDATGNLTRYGSVLHARLRAVNPNLPPNLIDDTLKQVARLNPRSVVEPQNLVAETLAAKEGVPLTAAMKTRDAKGIQDFESMQTGAVGTEAGQTAAIDRSGAIDKAITSNIRSVGNGEASDVASFGVASKLANREAAAKANVDALYKPLKESAEKIIAAPLKKVRADIYDDFGQGATDTLTDTAKGYLTRLNNLASVKKLGKPGTIRFGDVWKLSRDLNAAVKSANGPDTAQLRTIKKHLDDFIGNAPGDIFENGTNGVFKQLKDANAANRVYRKTFNASDMAVNAGRRRIPDQAGRAVERVVALAKQSAQDNEPLATSAIENAVFGQAKALDSSGSKQAVSTIRRILKAAPDTQPHLKAITVNRIVGQMEQGLFEKSLKPEAAQTVIKQAVEGNRGLLEAAGFSSADITRLQTNAYLASLKIAPAGARARGSSATNRGLGSKALAQGFRRALSAAVGVGGFASGGTLGAAVGYAAAEGALAAGSKVAGARLAKRTLSSTVKKAADDAGTRIGRKVGAKVGAQSARDIAD